MDRTYKMIGGDGREYGPAALDELLGWVREGRVAPMTPVWRSDEERWTPAGEVRELEDELEKLPPFDHAPAAVAPAGFWVRFAAHLIDQFLLALVIPLFVAPPQFPAGQTPSLAEMVRILSGAGEYLAISFIATGVYYTVMTGQFGATVGKLIFRMRVLRMDGSPVGFGMAALRFLGSMVSGLILCIGYLMVAFRADKRALHDLIAGTRVVFWVATPRDHDES